MVTVQYILYVCAKLNLRYCYINEKIKNSNALAGYFYTVSIHNTKGQNASSYIHSVFYNYHILVPALC